MLQCDLKQATDAWKVAYLTELKQLCKEQWVELSPQCCSVMQAMKVYIYTNMTKICVFFM